MVSLVVEQGPVLDQLVQVHRHPPRIPVIRGWR
jgi:hypothetical protein